LQEIIKKQFLFASVLYGQFFECTGLEQPAVIRRQKDGKKYMLHFCYNRYIFKSVLGRIILWELIEKLQ